MGLSFDELLEKLPDQVQPIRERLKPCPFCGGVGDLQNTHTPSYWIECGDCGAIAFDRDPHLNLLPKRARGRKVLAEHLASMERAAASWNERVDE